MRDPHAHLHRESTFFLSLPDNALKVSFRPESDDVTVMELRTLQDEVVCEVRLWHENLEYVMAWLIAKRCSEVYS